VNAAQFEFFVTVASFDVGQQNLFSHGFFAFFH
jgi:hypothetical protein